MFFLNFQLKKMKKILLLLFATMFAQAAAAQQKQKFKKYLVEFADKNQNPFCTCRPTDFLSPQSLERRERAGISVVENDLPPNPNYIFELRKTGAEIHCTSRWLNAAAVKVAGEDTIRQIEKLPFVKKISYLGPHLAARNPPNRALKKRRPLAEPPKIEGNNSVFGYATLQNSLIGTPFLYEIGARGQGIRVAVMDGGFTNVDTLPFFDRAAAENRLFSAHDFVERDDYVFEAAAHGTSVLSVMAADLPNYFVGTAPAATYFCLKTEDTGGEFPIEEVNWIAGAEWADSIGAHIVNASLGYTSFNDNSLSHKYLDLDGRTAIGSRGAAIAATKGMIICNSAGNSGDEDWRFVGIPSDAAGVIAVGSIQKNGEKSSFSSFGPTADGRIKPDLAAPGDMVLVASTSGTGINFSSGTSIASPMLAGGLASLWSAFPEKTAAEILAAAFAAASQNERPDNLLGWGVPSLDIAWLRFGGFLDDFGHSNLARLSIFPQPRKKEFGLFSASRAAGELSLIFLNRQFFELPEVVLVDVLGRRFFPKFIDLVGGEVQKLTFSGFSGLPAGCFQVLIFENGKFIRVGLLNF